MSRKVTKKSNTKIFVVIALIAAVAASSIAIVYQPGPTQPDLGKKLFCGSGVASSNAYIKEFLIPTPCSQPVGIAVDRDGMVWFAESAVRKIGKFDPGTGEFSEYELPGAKQQEEVMPIASIWSLKFDNSGNLWFPDVETNAIWKLEPQLGRFEVYKIPTETDLGTAYPINVEFDMDGRVWFSEIYGKNISVLDPSKAQHETSDGIKEFSPRVDLETLGPLAIGDDGSVWFTALTYGSVGRVMKLDPATDTFTTYNMPEGVSSPVGIAPDGHGNLWINDHGTSTFVKFNPAANSTTTYVTSLPLRKTSIGGYEDCLTQPYGSEITCPGLPVSLPYWNVIDDDGRIWFNEHQGNSIAVFDPDTETLVEYFIPTQNPAWAACENYSEPCGIANPLQFTLAPDGKVWFTEWSENKIGVLDPDSPLPVSLQVDGKTLAGARGETLTLNVAVTAKEKLSSGVEMRLSGTMIPAGRLFNMTAEFSERQLTFNDAGTKTVDLKVTPEETLGVGTYRLTVSAAYNDATYSRIVEVTVLPSKIQR